MASRGYTTSAAVAALLGATFDAAQAARCDGMIEALEAHLDATLRYRWRVPAPTVVFRGPLYPPLVVLGVAPLGTVTSVAVRSRAVSSAGTALLVGTGYEVADAERAILYVGGAQGTCGYPGRRVEVTYTLPNMQAVPADVELACRRTVAAWMAPTLPQGAATASGAGLATAAAAGVKSYAIGQELRLEFFETAGSSGSGGTADAGLPGAVPASAAAAFAPYGYPNRGFVGFA